MAQQMTPQELRDFITQTVQTAVQNLQPPAGQQGPPGPPGPPAPPVPPAASGNGDSRWNAADLGFFDPHLDKSYGEGEVVTVGKDTYYRSPILFVERIRDLATVKGAALVRSNLNTALRGSALAWYTAELSNLERVGLRADENGVEEWCSAITKRFKESTGVALHHLTSEKYSLHDARTRREPAAYVQAILRHAKSANIDSVENQLTFAYQGIAAELRAFVDPPTSTSTIASFIQILEMKKDTWFEMNSHRQILNQARPQGNRQNQPNQQQQLQAANVRPVWSSTFPRKSAVSTFPTSTTITAHAATKRVRFDGVKSPTTGRNSRKSVPRISKKRRPEFQSWSSTLATARFPASSASESCCLPSIGG